jgi:hypothetical protein
VSAVAARRVDVALAGAPAPGPVREVIYPLVAVLMAGVAYAPIVANYFHADDFYYLYLLNDHRPLEFLLTPHGGHVLFLRNLVFMLFHAAFGTDPRGYFLVVLFTHLVNVGLLYDLIRRFTASARLACFGAGLWGMCPTHEGSLGWYSVYGHVLVATLLLAVLVRVARAAADPAGDGGRWWPLVCVTALVLGGTAFGVGLGIALVFPLVAALLLRGPAQRRARRTFWLLPIAVPLVYLLSHALYFAVSTQVDELSLGLAQGALRAWAIIPIMMIHLLNFSLVSLLTGPFVPVLPYPAPWVYAVVVAFGLAVGALTLGGPDEARRRLWACAVLAVGAYAVIAVGRAPILSFVMLPSSSAAVWPRYHYVGSIPLTVMTCILLGALARGRGMRPRRADALLAGWAAVSLLGWARYAHAIDHHPRDRWEAMGVTGAIRSWVGKAPPGGPAYIGNVPFQSVDFAGANPGVFPGWAAIFVAFFPDDVVDGKLVYFVTDSPPIAAAVRARTGSRTADLLVTQHEQMSEVMSLQCLPRQ